LVQSLEWWCLVLNGNVGKDPARGSGVYPELVVCLCAAVGTDTGIVTEALDAELLSVGYMPVPIRLSKLMSEVPGLESLADLKEEDVRIRTAMQAGNAIRRKLNEKDAVARLALTTIHETRDNLNHEVDLPAERHCFIISSLKRLEEFETMKNLFGSRALLISIYEPRDQRCRNLCKRIAKSRHSPDPSEFKEVAENLIDIDQKERGDQFGQELERVFPRADFFLKADHQMRENVRRFIQLLFRAPYVTPTVDELAMFHARAASQRTADLSRQVGAVIATETGEILSTGCNEVPRAGGGVNWDAVANTSRDYRDFKVGQDAAAAAKKEIVTNIMEALKAAGWLEPELGAKDSAQLAHEALYSDAKPLKGTMVTDLLEFGRIVHAEMAAICDAALRGVSVKGGTL
jgi:deoxycytidylate deaminase